VGGSVRCALFIGFDRHFTGRSFVASNVSATFGVTAMGLVRPVRVDNIVNNVIKPFLAVGSSVSQNAV